MTKAVTKIRASSLDRAMVCAAFLQLPEQEYAETEKAKEGTAFGELVRLRVHENEVPPQASNGVYFDSEMFYHVEHLKPYIPKNANSEMKCSWQSESGIWISGRYDFSWISEDGSTLFIDDVKYGWGLVEAKRSWQLIAYAIGEVVRLQRHFEKITMRILQPRPHHEDGAVREWTVTYDELISLKAELDARLFEISRGNTSAQTGEKCRFCTGTYGTCPAFSRAFYNSIDVFMAEYQPDSLNEFEIMQQLDLIDRAEDIIAIKVDGLKELARIRIREGKVIPNYTMRDNYGHRKWKDGMTAEFIQMFTGFDILEKKPMSPAQAAKQLKIPDAVIESMTKRPYTGVSLVRKDTGAEADKVFNNTVGGK